MSNTAKKSSTKKQLDKANKKLSELDKFEYSDDAGLKKLYKEADKDYNSWINNPEKYGYNAYSGDVDSLFNQLMNQEKFSYDPKTDKLFQMYKEQYQNMGQRAMQNQMGAASALSGGYNSSAAQTSSQNAYRGFLNALSKRAGETYQNAVDRYRYNQQNLLDKFGAARDMNNSGNEAYWKGADIRNQKANSAYNAYNDERNFQYNSFSGDRNFYQNQGKNAMDQLNWLKEYALQKKLYKGS